jgi:hypothetical protein
MAKKSIDKSIKKDNLNKKVVKKKTSIPVKKSFSDKFPFIRIFNSTKRIRFKDYLYMFFIDVSFVFLFILSLFALAYLTSFSISPVLNFNPGVDVYDLVKLDSFIKDFYFLIFILIIISIVFVLFLSFIMGSSNALIFNKLFNQDISFKDIKRYFLLSLVILVLSILLFFSFLLFKESIGRVLFFIFTLFFFPALFYIYKEFMYVQKVFSAIKKGFFKSINLVLAFIILFFIVLFVWLFINLIIGDSYMFVNKILFALLLISFLFLFDYIGCKVSSIFNIKIRNILFLLNTLIISFIIYYILFVNIIFWVINLFKIDILSYILSLLLTIAFITWLRVYILITDESL